MAKLSADGKYVIVEKGDSLWGIAEDHLGSGTKNKQLAAANNIPNSNLIYPGQKVYLDGSGGSSSSNKSTTSNVAKVSSVRQQSNAENTLFVTWEWNRDNTENYEVEWYYDTGDGVWFLNGSKSTTDQKYSTCSIPSNAKKIRVRVKPISKTYKNGDKETSYWTANWSSYSTWTDSTPLATPGVPSVEIEKFKLTASLDNIDIKNAYEIEFQVVKDNYFMPFSTKKAIITSRHASYAFTIEAGGEYKVRARAYNGNTKTYSEWSDYSENKGTMPAASSGITNIKATSDTSVYLEWKAANSAKTYEIEYTTEKRYFDGSNETTKVSAIEFTHYEITGLATGDEYFFRVRAVNNDGESAWTEPKSVVIGKNPSAPTTWSSTTTAIVGEILKLYWVHNAEDGSSETYAELELYIDGFKETHHIQNTETDEDEKDKTKFYTVDTSSYTEGTQIQWRVRTAGVTKAYGDWSVQRTVDVYAPPTLALSITNLEGEPFETLTSFPFYVYALAGPNTQAPIGYHLTITSNEIYETVDNVGNVKMVNVGEAVYSKYFDITDSLLVEMSAGNINLDNNISYKVTCTVSMNSGLTAEASTEFTVAWTDVTYSPNAEIGFDKDTFVAHVRPYCEEGTLNVYKVIFENDVYTKTEEIIEEGIYREPLEDVFTTTGERVWVGTTSSGTELYFCEIEHKTLVDGITLSLYRREFDGSFTELATGLKNIDCTFVTDPHPSLDYARYRVVAITDATGAVSFYDVPGHPINEPSIIIQWDEEWSNFDTTNADEMQQPPWSGSLLRLPYNVDVSEGNKPDVMLVNYIGRTNPVSYYGTQIGSTATWNTEIEADDKDTIYALRRLQTWMGDVYVREPSGTGYWANITVSFNQKHLAVTIPVTFNITRVEGGI